MRSCCVKYCRSESFGGCGISFYRIPKKEPIRQKWIDAIGYVPKRKNAVVCSSHFRPKELTFSGLRPKVAPGAVPSIFPTEPTAPLIAQLSPGPSQTTPDTLDSYASTEELHDALRRVSSDSNASTEEPQVLLRRVSSDSNASTEEPQVSLRRFSLDSNTSTEELLAPLRRFSSDSNASTEEPLAPLRRVSSVPNASTRLQGPLIRVSSVSNASTKPQGPLRQDTKQCRFCGKYNKDCVPISPTHLAVFTTKLAFNEIVVEFIETLPKTVCRECDVKLEIIYDFVKTAKAAQETVINVKDGKDMVNDRLEDNNSIVDLSPAENSVFIKDGQKRKSNSITVAKPKKAKVTNSESEKEETKMIIHKEVIDRKVNAIKTARDRASGEERKHLEKPGFQQKDSVLLNQLKNREKRDNTNEADKIGFSSDSRTNEPGHAKVIKRVFVRKVTIGGKRCVFFKHNTK